MRSRLLSISLGLNLLLLGVAGYWASHSVISTRSATEPVLKIHRSIQPGFPLDPTTPALAAFPAPLRWSDLESENYPTYIANLRNAGCPERVLRRIIGGELNELYARKAFASLQEFHRDFWEIAARENVGEYFETNLAPKVKALSKESDLLLKQLLGEAPRESSPARGSTPAATRFTDFLSPALREQLRELTQRYGAQLQAIRESNLPPEERAAQLAQVRTELEREQARMLSPDDLAEYRLRQSDAAKQVQQLYGVDFSETELRAIANVVDDYQRNARNRTEDDVPSETLDQKLTATLGATRFADLNRASSADYRELCELASDYELPSATAAEVFDLRLESEKQSDAIRADKHRPVEEKQMLLDALQEQVEQTVLTKFGAGAYQSYKATHGRWINSLGRL